MMVAATLVVLSNSNSGKQICFGSNNRRWSKEREQKRDEKGVWIGGGQGDGSDSVQVAMKGGQWLGVVADGHQWLQGRREKVREN